VILFYIKYSLNLLELLYLRFLKIKNIQKYSKIFKNIQKYSKIFKNIQKYSKIFKNIQKYSKIY
jgi:hypothetical protein